MDFTKLTDDELQLAENLAKWTKGKFSEDQFNIAKKVQERSKLKGLNPDFVLPMVMAESGFNPSAKSPKGAMGVMQITQDTADTYKCKNPQDVDQNIDCGLNILSDLVAKKNIGNNPYKVLTAYNAGPSTKYFASGNIKDMPDETINHMDKISTFYGGSLPTVATGEASTEQASTESAGQTESSEQAEVEPAGENGAPVAPKASSEIPGKSEADKPFLGMVGAVSGAGVAGSLETGKKLIPLLPNIIGRIGGNAPGPATVMTRAGLQSYLNSQIAPNLRLPLTELEKVSGAGKIRTMSEVQNALKAIQAVEEQKVAKPMVKMIEGRPGVYEQTGRFTTSTTPGKPAVSLAPYEIPEQGPMRAAVGRQLQTAGEVTRSIAPSAGRVGLGVLGGANAVMTGYDAWEMAQKLKKANDPSWIDWARLATKGAATLGGGLSMLPFGLTQGAGIALQAPEMVWSGAESLGRAMKNADKEQVDRSLSSVDPMGNPIGGLP